MALMSDRCQSNGKDHLSNFNTLETTRLHSHTALQYYMICCEFSHVPGLGTVCRLGHLVILLAAAAISRGGVKINVSCSTIKLDVDLDPPVDIWFQIACV